MKRLIVIGGGASGMICALTAARLGAKVLVLERNAKALKKLSASGNGRGNLLNRNGYRFYGDVSFVKKVFEQVSPVEIENFWNHTGVFLVHEEEGRMYPASFSAAAVTEALLCSVLEAGVEIHYNTKALSIEKTKAGFLLACEESILSAPTVRKNGKVKAGEILSVIAKSYMGDAVAICGGGSAAPQFGTDGNAYELAQHFGHHLRKPGPALCALTTQEKFPTALLGQRVKASLRLVDRRGCQLGASEGEVLFAEHAVSGIAAMQLARFFVPGCELQMNISTGLFGKQLFEKEIKEWLLLRKTQFPGRTLQKLLIGCTTQGLREYLGLAENIEALAKRIAVLTIPIDGTRSFESAQVTAGGLCCDEWNPSTMESRLQPGLYAAGEVLDVDGDCGGYNLMFAAATGMIAGESAGKTDGV